MRKTINLDKVKVHIMYDESPESPRTWGNLGKCIFSHRRYNFGDKHNFDPKDYNNKKETEKALVEKFDAVVFLPVYLYDHSGITIKTTPFGDRWDSGQLGYIVASRADVIKEYSVKKRISAKVKKRVTERLESEIENLDTYIRGEIFGFQIVDKATGEDLDSCWGFYGDTADNGIFDYIDSNYATKEQWETAYKAADWKEGREVTVYDDEDEDFELK